MDYKLEEAKEAKKAKEEACKLLETTSLDVPHKHRAHLQRIHSTLCSSGATETTSTLGSASTNTFDGPTVVPSGLCNKCYKNSDGTWSKKSCEGC